MRNEQITSDLHFYHKGIIRMQPATRPWENTDDMTEGLIEAWNENINDSSTTYHLGDFLFGGTNRVCEVIDRLRGRIVFIRGNHDQALVKALNRMGHSDRLELRDYMELNRDGRKIVMHHYPLLVWNKNHHGSVMLHGHCHGSLNYLNEGKRRLDVGWDSLGRIVELSEAIGMISDNEMDLLDHHG